MWMTKPIYVFCTWFFGGAGVTGFLCPLWTSGSPDCCHWATKTPWSCACYWSRCDHQAILWIGSMNLPYFYLHGSQRTRAADSTNQGLAGGVDHRKSDSAADVILQPDAIPVSVTDAITGTCTASRAWGWSLSCSCQHKGELCWSFSERSRYEWLRQIRVVHRRKSSPPSRPRKSLWGIHNRSQHPLLHDQVKVNVEEVKDADAPVPIPIDEVNLVGQTLNTFLAWATHLLKRLSEQVFCFH